MANYAVIKRKDDKLWHIHIWDTNVNAYAVYSLLGGYNTKEEAHMALGQFISRNTLRQYNCNTIGVAENNNNPFVGRVKYPHLWNVGIHLLALLFAIASLIFSLLSL